MKVYVVMGNDYPDCVFKEEVAAARYCDFKFQQQKKEKPDYPPRIYWRYYSFDLKEDKA